MRKLTLTIVWLVLLLGLLVVGGGSTATAALSDGTVKSHRKISDTQGGFTGVFDDADQFGISNKKGSGYDKLTVLAPSFGNERLDPAFSWDSMHYSRIMHRSLISTNENSELMPGIASAWELSADGRGLLFTIRNGVKFHNGMKMSTEDVLWSLQHSFGPQAHQYVSNRSAQRISTRMNSIEQVGPRQVQVTFNDSATGFSEFISEAGPSSWGIMPKRDSLHDEVQEATYELNPVAVGPMKLVGHTAGEIMAFERFGAFYYQPKRGLPEDRRVKFNSLDLRLVPELATRVAALRAGQADIASVDRRGRIEAGGGRVIFGQEGAYLMVRLLGCWEISNPCQDLRVRQALAYGIDKELMRDTLYGPEAMQVKGWAAVTTSTIGYSPALDPFAYDPEKARALLAEAGYKTPTNPEGKDFGTLGINTWVSSATPFLPETAQLAAENWKRELGIDAEVLVGDQFTLKKASRAGDLNGQILWRDNEARLDATSIVMNLYGNPDSPNRSHEDPELFAMVQAALAVHDSVQREQALNALYQRLRLENYEIGVGYTNIPWGVGPRVLNWRPYPLAIYPSALHTITLK